MIMGENDDLERWLNGLEFKPAPSDLREKVLRAAVKYKEETAWTTPLLRKCLAGCGILLALIFLTDHLLSRAQQDRVQALLDRSRQVRGQADDQTRFLAEVLEDLGGSTKLVQKEMAVGREKKAERVRRADILRELLKEEFIDGERTKDFH
jgi:hypothetical protein